MGDALGMRGAISQNAAHRADLLWAKVGRSEYLRSDGVTIRKGARHWEIYLPNGARAAMPNSLEPSGFIVEFAAWGHSLTVAKYEAGMIDADSPAYVGFDVT